MTESIKRRCPARHSATGCRHIRKNLTRRTVAPPAGDPVRSYIDVETLDLETADGREQLEHRLRRFGLDRTARRRRHRSLSPVTIRA